MQFQIYQADSLDSLTEQIQPDQWRPYRSLLVQAFVTTSSALLTQVSHTLRQLLPHSQIIGTTATESILQARTTAAPIVVTVTAFSATRLKPILLPDLADPALAERMAQRLNRQLRKTPDCRLTIMFWDGRHAAVEPFLNRLRPLPDQAIVGGLASPARDGSTAVLINERLLTDGMVALCLHNPQLRVFTGYHFGWEPVSVAHLVTRAEGKRVYEINYQPAIALYRRYLDENAALESGLSFPLLLEDRRRLIARTPMKVHEDGSIEFAGEIRSGQLVRLSFGDRRRMLKAQYENGLPNAEALFIYSCIGRRLFLEQQADQTMEIFARLPNGGFYTHGEIVTEQGEARLYNETMTFVAVAERPMPAIPRPSMPAHLHRPSTVDRFITLLHRAHEDTRQLEMLLNNNAMAFLTLVKRDGHWLPARVSRGIRMLGLEATELLQRQEDFFQRLPRQDRERLLQSDGQARQIIAQIRHEQGHYLPVMLRMVRQPSEDDALDTLYLLVEDLTPQEHLKRIFAMFEQGPVVLFEWQGLMERLLYVSSNAASVLNLDVKALQRDRFTLEDAVVEDDRPALIRAIEQALLTQRNDFQHAFRILDRDGRLHWVNSHLHAIFTSDGDMAYLYGFLLDVTAEKSALQALQAEKNRIAELAARDALTRLDNRATLEKKLARLDQAEEEGWHGLFFIDLDHFKEANDLYGHAAGDEVLIQFAQRLRACVRHLDATLARFGGDEFVILARNLGEDRPAARKRAETLAQSVLTAAATPFSWREAAIHIGASIGVLLFRHGDPDTLLRYSDTSMYLAKRSGRQRWHFFSETEQRAEEARTACLQALRHAVSRDQLWLAFQPQLRWRDQRLEVIGAEVLLRWQHPEWGLIPPGRFLPLAEEHGLMPQLENWMLDNALAQLALWRQRSPDLFDEDFVLSLNISESGFRQADFAENVIRLCRHYRLPPRQICLELTERMVHHDLDYTLGTLAQLKQAGFRLALDDFGTGYSSLSHLKNLPIDLLKIDRSFVQSLPDNPQDALITRTIVQLARNFDLDIIAEGIETAETMKRIIPMGCHCFQGFYIARPMRADKLPEWIARFARRLRQARTRAPSHTLSKGTTPHALH